MKRVSAQDEHASELLAELQVRRNMMARLHAEWLETLWALGGNPGMVAVNGRIIDTYAELRRRIAQHQGGALVRVEHNFLLTQLRTKLAAGLQNLPQPVCALLAPTKAARESKRAQEALLRHLYLNRETGFRHAEEDALAWAFITGTGWMGVTWDDEAGRPTWEPVLEDGAEKIAMRRVAFTTEGEPVWQTADGAFSWDRATGGVVRVGQKIEDLDLIKTVWGTPLTEQMGMPEGKWRLSGNVAFWAPSPFDVFWTPARKYEQARRTYLVSAEDEDRLVATYGSKARGLPTTIHSDEIIQFGDTDDFDGQNSVRRFVFTVQVFERPSKAYPFGRYFVIAGGKTMAKERLPAGRNPLSIVHDLRNPSSVAGWSGLRQAVPVQRNLNELETNRAATMAYHANPRLLAEEGAIKGGITRVPNEPGAIVQYERGKDQPKWLEPPQLSAVVATEPGRLQKVMEDVGGVQSVTKGDNAGLQSGRQAAVIAALNAMSWGPTLQSLSKAIAEVSETALLLVRAHGPAAMNVEIYGPANSPVDVLVFHKDRHIGHSVTVHIDASSMQPFNPELRRQQILESFNVGIYKDQFEARRALRHNGLGFIDGADDHSRARACQENDILGRGTTLYAMEHEDHDAHLEEHLLYMQSPEWYDLDQRVQKLYLDHVRHHFQLAAFAQSPALAAGRPPQLGDGSGAENMPPSMTSPGQMRLPGSNLAQEALSEPT